MRVMMMIRANKDTESGILPKKQLLEAMGAFNEEMIKAGVMLGGEGLKPSSAGARVKFSGGKHNVIDGPFAEAKELIAGFWLLQVRSLEEAIEWASRCPGGHGEVDHFGGEFSIDIRPLYEASDFPPDVFSDEARAQEEAQREKLARKDTRSE